MKKFILLFLIWILLKFISIKLNLNLVLLGFGVILLCNGLFCFLYNNYYEAYLKLVNKTKLNLLSKKPVEFKKYIKRQVVLSNFLTGFVSTYLGYININNTNSTYFTFKGIIFAIILITFVAISNVISNVILSKSDSINEYTFINNITQLMESVIFVGVFFIFIFM